MEVPEFFTYFVFQSAFMNNPQDSLSAVHEIRRMMERSERFISLSGWSGIVAGFSGLAGAWYADRKIEQYLSVQTAGAPDACLSCLSNHLLSTALVVLVAALSGSFLFTWLKASKEGVLIWGNSAKRLLWNTALPMVVGGLVVLRLLQIEQYSLVAPLSLVFYGLGLINGSKYTLGTVRYLGYGQVLLGLFSLWRPGQGLAFWALGFGVLHIVYGFAMWWKHDRTTPAPKP